MDEETYADRWENAKKIALKFNELRSAGYTILDHECIAMDATFVITEDEIYIQEPGVITYMYSPECFLGEPETITEYNAFYKDWIVIPPNSPKPFLEFIR